MGCGSSTAPTGAIEPAATGTGGADPTIPGSYPSNPTGGATIGTNPMAGSNASTGQPTTSPLPPTRVNPPASSGGVITGGPRGNVVVGTGTLIQPSRPMSRPLQKPPSYRHTTDITLGDLNNQRVEFWATRTTGNVHMWQAIRSAAEALCTDDLMLAQAIMEASNISTPSGNLDLVYDELGAAYRVPAYLYSVPINVIDPNARLPSATMVNDKVTDRIPSVVVAHPLTVKIRINPGDHNMSIPANTADSILDLKHSILTQASLLAEKEPTKNRLPFCDENRQRVMFMGRELQNAQLLGEVGVDESKVVQVFLRPLPPNTTAATATVTVKATNTTATATATVADTTTTAAEVAITTITPTTATIVETPSPIEDDHTVAVPSEIHTAPSETPIQNPSQIILDREVVPTLIGV